MWGGHRVAPTADAETWGAGSAPPLTPGLAQLVLPAAQAWDLGTSRTIWDVAGDEKWIEKGKRALYLAGCER